MPSHALLLQATGPGGTETFDMRYFVCDAHKRTSEAGEPGPIFFYLGNESNVLLCMPPLCTPQLYICPCVYVGYNVGYNLLLQALIRIVAFNGSISMAVSASKGNTSLSPQ